MEFPKIEERLKSIQFNAKHRHASVEEATAGLVGNIVEAFSEALNEKERLQHVGYALTHFVVQLGNIAAALNEISVAQQELTALAVENYRLDLEAQAENEKQRTVNQGRDFLGKGRLPS